MYRSNVKVIPFQDHQHSVGFSPAIMPPKLHYAVTNMFRSINYLYKSDSSIYRKTFPPIRFIVDPSGSDDVRPSGHIINNELEYYQTFIIRTSFCLSPSFRKNVKCEIHCYIDFNLNDWIRILINWYTNTNSHWFQSWFEFMELKPSIISH